MKKKIITVLVLMIGLFTFQTNVSALSLEEVSNNSSIILKQGSDNIKKLEELCSAKENPQIVAFFRFLGFVVMIVKILVPIILIVIGMIEISKAVTNANEGEIQKNIISFIKRVIIGVLVFFVPTIILGIFKSVTNINNDWKTLDKNYGTCLKCMLDVGDCPKVSLINSNQGDNK